MDLFVYTRRVRSDAKEDVRKMVHYLVTRVAGIRTEDMPPLGECGMGDRHLWNVACASRGSASEPRLEID